MPDGADAFRVKDALVERGVIARALGASTVAFCPPLVISDADIDHCLESLGDAVRAQR